MRMLYASTEKVVKGNIFRSLVLPGIFFTSRIFFFLSFLRQPLLALSLLHWLVKQANFFSMKNECGIEWRFSACDSTFYNINSMTRETLFIHILQLSCSFLFTFNLDFRGIFFLFFHPLKHSLSPQLYHFIHFYDFIFFFFFFGYQLMHEIMGAVCATYLIYDPFCSTTVLL